MSEEIFKVKWRRVTKGNLPYWLLEYLLELQKSKWCGITRTVPWVRIKSQEIFASIEKKEKKEETERTKVALQVGMYLALSVMTDRGGEGYQELLRMDKNRFIFSNCERCSSRIGKCTL